MGRLIDADVMKTSFETNCKEINDFLINLIDSQPTAFDVDTIVRNIKMLRHPYTTFPEGFGDLNAYDFYINKAIEIVK